MVTDQRFTKEKGPGQSWVDLGREFGMKEAEARLKRELIESAVATLL